MQPLSSLARRCGLLLAAAALAACGGGSGKPTAETSRYQVEIRRTEMGLPHIKAKDWASLGYGSGYAQAQDNLCTLADGFATYRGERSRFWGADAMPTYRSTVQSQPNIESDFFFRHVVDDEAVRAAQQGQPDSLNQLMAGYVAGYNRWLRDMATAGGQEHAACRGMPWVRPITTDDMWRRVYIANLAGGYSNFVREISTAAPPAAAPAGAAARQGRQLPGAGPRPLAPIPPLNLRIGGMDGIGSNMYGFGPQVTGSDSSVLFGNPHWFWTGPDRLYQFHLTIPGELDVSGAGFLGLPLVQIGFNNHVAWSHTVSTAWRFGLFQYVLDPADPSHYQRDGAWVPMQASTISIEVLNAAGEHQTLTRTLYKTEHGPLLNLGNWGPTTAFALRDINAGNHRGMRNWMRWSQAASLDEFMRIQKEEAAIPWVNTVAIGRGSAQAWYADIGAVPNAPADASCVSPAAPLLASVLPQGVPVLLAVSSQCDWVTDADSVQAGAIGPARMPSLLRSDYVANMNDSYWLTNVHQPLTGYPAIFGPTGHAQSLRTRMGHAMVLDRLQGRDDYAGRWASADIVRDMVLDSRVYSAAFKEEALAMVCEQPSIDLDGAAVQVGAACAALAAWDGRGNADSRGSHVWDEFWRATLQAGVDVYATPFDAADPVHTPRGVKASAGPALQRAFASAVRKLQVSGFAMDAPRSAVLYSARGADRIGLYGGCGNLGYFTINCSEREITAGGYSMDGHPHGNSYMQVVSFPPGPVQAHSFLTYSLSDDPHSPHYVDYTRAYGAKQWLAVPFTDSAIAASAALRTHTLSE